jgi:hypothetical protein
MKLLILRLEAIMAEYDMPVTEGHPTMSDALDTLETEIYYAFKRMDQVRRRPWVGLTDDDRHAVTQSPFTEENYRAIEAALKDKN